MNFSEEEIARYARHIVLREVGGPGQQKLKAARVLVVGGGGLGAPALQYLGAAGVGTLGVADGDTVSLSNLQRQVIHDTEAVGMLKVESAKRAVTRLNPHVAVETHAKMADEENIAELIARYDLVLDCTDNFAARYLISDACCRGRRTLITGAVGQFDATLTTLKPFLSGSDAVPNPTYRCLFPEPPPDGLLPSCAEAGILGALPGVVGGLMALEALKEIVGFGESLVRRLLIYDALAVRFETIEYRWDPANPLTGTRGAA